MTAANSKQEITVQQQPLNNTKPIIINQQVVKNVQDYYLRGSEQQA